MNAGEVMDRLRRHYIAPGKPLPGGVFVPEVGWNGGPNGRRCDAIFIGFTGTSGRLLIGHEVKVSRADWRAELSDAHKADEWERECHAWYVVAPNTTVVPPEELPHGWGLLTCEGPTRTRMTVAVKAEVHADRVPSWTAVRSIVARLDTLRAQTVAEARVKADEEASARVRERVDAELSVRVGHEERAARDALAAIEKALGRRYDQFGWRGGDTFSADDLAALAPLLPHLTDLTRATDRIVSGYRDAAARWRTGMASMDDATDALVAAGRLNDADEDVTTDTA